MRRAWKLGFVVLAVLFVAATLRLNAHLQDPSRSIIKVEAGESYAWPYFLYLPKSAENRTPTYLLVEPNNTGSVDDDPKVHEEAAKRLVSRRVQEAEALGTPLLIPAFPRFNVRPHVYTHALSREALVTELRGLEHLDLQLIAMIEDARARLADKGMMVEAKVLMMGFSASGSFTSRFTVLHPERIKAAAIGAPGGWPIVPLSHWQGQVLAYPVGVANLEGLTGTPFDIEAFRGVPLFFYLGDQDNNDSVPYRDSFSALQADLVFELFVSNPVNRWSKAEESYRSAGSNAQFALYPSVGHNRTTEMIGDVRDFFHSALD